MKDPYEYPCLRWPLDLRFEQIEDQEVLLVRCPLGVSPTPLLLVRAVAPILSSFEGTLSVSQIVERFAPYGANPKLIQEIISILDKHLFLATPAYFNAERELRDQFARLDRRAAALAGGGYAEDGLSLGLEIDGYLQHRADLLSPTQHPLIGLVSPHIDYRRGSACYGITYNQLRALRHQKDSRPALYILMGTSHQYSEHLFQLTGKTFETPLGECPCDSTFVKRLAQLYGYDRSFADEILHKKEHSLELQLPFLKRLENGVRGSESRIVPILIGSFHEMLDGSEPQSVAPYDDFVGALATTIQERTAQGETICFIAGVDMAHVGRAFGDGGALTPEYMQQIEARDRQYLDAIAVGNKEALFSHVAEDKNARRLCGFPTLYTLMDLLERLNLRYEAKVFDYRQAVDYARDCAVTFAGMGIFEITVQ